MGLVVNGRFLARPITGVERYGRMILEVIAREWPNARVIVPRSAPADVAAFGLELVRTNGIGGHAWEQLILPRYIGTNDILLSPANTGPLRVRQHAVVVHDLAVVHHPEWFDRRFAAWYNFLLPRLVRRATKVITVSARSAADIRQTYALKDGHVAVVPPFIATGTWGNVDPGIGSPYCLVVGSFDPRKGMDRAFEWYRSLNAPPFKLVCVGRAINSFAQIDVPELDGMILLNDVDDDRLAALYKGAIALYQPSRFEGFGLPILEAMHHGCPVVASDLLVFRELFEDNILYAEIGGTPSMVDAMYRVSNGTEREQIIQRAARHAATYSLERTTKALHAALDPMLNT
ncbi:MAG: glycosyltransferase family 4 protein [Flavobacteriales bacterium]|nr:glycosyltransferase family 4 protein [Flavobacteriales bacterium]